MAYGLKYYKNLAVSGSNDSVRLEVLQRDYTGSVQEFGTLNGLVLNIQGESNPVYNPVTKTNLIFSVVDMDSLSTSTKKCGRWEEFFTPDSTLYLVQLKIANSVVWSGYVTPDSWEEDLSYGGSISVTARDMLGSLSDVDFNMRNKVSIRNLISTAITTSKCPMQLVIREDDMLINKNGQSILDASISASTFDDDWWSALEDAIEALGLVLRWNGHNKLVLTSLRHIQDIYDSEKVVRFINETGHRTLDAAVKNLVDTLKIETGVYEPIEQDEDDLEIQANTLRQEVNIKIPTGYYSVFNETDHYTSEATTGWMADSSKSIFAKITDPLVTPVQKDEGAIYILPNIVDRTSLEKDSKSSIKYSDSSLSLNSKLIIRQGGDLLTSGESQMYPVPSTMYASSIEVRVEATINGTRMAYAYHSWESATLNPDKFTTIGFSNGEATLEIPKYSLNGIEYDGNNVTIRIRNARTGGYIEWSNLPEEDTFGDNYPAEGLWLPITIGFEERSEARYESEFITTTEYNESYNVKLKREPVIGSADVNLPAWLVNNVLTYDTLVARNLWHWKGASSELPLAVMIHRQLLCFYAAATSVITGNAILNDSNYLIKLSKYSYSNRHLIATGGDFDFKVGYLSGSRLREYYRYNDIWDDGGTDSSGDLSDDVDVVVPGSGSSGGQTMPIALSVSPKSVTIISPNGATGTIVITADSNLSYNISSNASWLTVSASSGQGSMTLTYYVSELVRSEDTDVVQVTTDSRTGIITIGTSKVTVTHIISNDRIPTGNIIDGSLEESTEEEVTPPIDDESIKG